MDQSVSFRVAKDDLANAVAGTKSLASTSGEVGSHSKVRMARLLVPAKTLQDTGRSLDTHLNIPVENAVGTGENIGAEGLFGLQPKRPEGRPYRPDRRRHHPRTLQRSCPCPVRHR